MVQIPTTYSISATGFTDVPSQVNFDAYKTSTNASIAEIQSQISSLTARIKALEDAASANTVLLNDPFNLTYNLLDGQVSPDGNWKMKYVSGGKVESANGVLTMYPKAATTSTQTYSTLLMSTKKFRDFQLDFDMKTVQMLRTGPSQYGVNGQGPQPWETGWIFFSYNDEAEGPLQRSNHHYYALLKTSGFEFGKKDNAVGDVTNEQQIFLKTTATPKVVVGVSNHWTIIKQDFHIIIKIDGVTVVDMVDTPNDPVRMDEGLIGLYEEDSKVTFDNVKVVGL